MWSCFLQYFLKTALTQFQVLQNIIEIIKESSDENHIPSIYLAYKEREEELDKLIFEEADERGFLIQEVFFNKS